MTLQWMCDCCGYVAEAYPPVGRNAQPPAKGWVQTTLGDFCNAECADLAEREAERRRLAPVGRGAAGAE